MAEEKGEGMSYEELLQELKIMKRQIFHHRSLSKEMNILDAQYWQVYKLDKLNSLPFIRIPDATDSSS